MYSFVVWAMAEQVLDDAWFPESSAEPPPHSTTAVASVSTAAHPLEPELKEPVAEGAGVSTAPHLHEADLNGPAEEPAEESQSSEGAGDLYGGRKAIREVIRTGRLEGVLLGQEHREGDRQPMPQPRRRVKQLETQIFLWRPVSTTLLEIGMLSYEDQYHMLGVCHHSKLAFQAFQKWLKKQLAGTGEPRLTHFDLPPPRS